jgi:glutaminase
MAGTIRDEENFVTPATRQLFHAFETIRVGRVSSQAFLGFLTRQGLCVTTDERFANMVRSLEELGAVAANRDLTLQEFAHAAQSCSTLLHRAATGDLRVPDFGSLRAVIERVYRDVLPNKEGENAQYIPQVFFFFCYKRSIEAPYF